MVVAGRGTLISCISSSSLMHSSALHDTPRLPHTHSLTHTSTFTLATPQLSHRVGRYIIPGSKGGAG